MKRIQSTRPLSHEKKIEKLRAAGTRARTKLALAAGDEEQPDIAHAPLSWWRKRWADRTIQRLFIENFIYVRDAFDENKLTLLKFNDLQADLFEELSGRDVLIKFRRGGASTIIKAKDLADAVVNSGRSVRIVPHDPDTEGEFRMDVKIMFENLPNHLKPATRYYSDDRIWIDDQLRGTVDSRITTSTVVPGHESKGRGQTITNLLLTEPPHWRGDQRKAATALIEAAKGGCVMVESTPFGIDWTFSIYQQGKSGKGGWKSHFYEWWWKRDYRLEGARFRKARGQWVLVKPGEKVKDVWRILPAEATEAQRAANRERFEAARFRLQDDEGKPTQEFKVALLILKHLKAKKYVSRRAKWNCDEVAECLAWRRAKIEELPGGERQFMVEYPENDQDCFEQSGRPVVSMQYLKSPCEMSQPKVGRSYVIGADPSLGLESGNPAGIVIVDITTGQTVHEEKTKRAPDLLAYRLEELSDIYNGAEIVPERNNMGIAVIQKLIEDGYDDRVYRHLDAPLLRKVDSGELSIDEAKELAKPGFPTTAEVKPVSAMMLEESIRRKWLSVGPQFIEEARNVVWFDNGTFGAQPGFEDDLFMAQLIANYVIRCAEFLRGGFVGVLPEVGHAR